MPEVICMMDERIKTAMTYTPDRAIAHMIVYRDQKRSEPCFTGSNIVAMSELKLEQHLVGPKKDIPVSENEAFRVDKQIIRMIYTKKAQYVVVSCNYSLYVARAIALASNNCLSLYGADRRYNETYDKEVYEAMIKAYDTIKKEQLAIRKEQMDKVRGVRCVT